MQEPLWALLFQGWEQPQGTADAFLVSLKPHSPVNEVSLLSPPPPVVCEPSVSC